MLSLYGEVMESDRNKRRRAKTRQRLSHEPWITSLHTVTLDDGSTMTAYAKNQRAAELVISRWLLRMRSNRTVTPTP